METEWRRRRLKLLRPCLRRQLPVGSYQRTGLAPRLNFQAVMSDRRYRIIVDWDGQPRIDREIAPGLDRGSDRGRPMRILSISLLVFASSASAQSPPSVACDAVNNSTVPTELCYHGQNGPDMVDHAYA